MGPVIELDVDALAAGGDAVAREGPAADAAGARGGKVVFVRGAAPGDRIAARVVERHAGWSRAELVRVIAPGAARVVPRCPLAAAGTCGGCPWQHVARAAQLAAKEAIVRGALRRAIAEGLEVRPIRAAAPDAGWRRRARLHWARPGAGPAVLGYFAPRSHRVTDVATCPQLDPRLDAALGAVRALAPALGGKGEVHLVLGAAGDVHVVVDGPCPEDRVAALVGRAGIAGARASGGGARRDFGAAAVEIDAEIAGAADDFAQASADGNRALGDEVAAALGPGDGRRLLELYAGGGNLTRHALALGWAVTAVDAAAPARPLPGAVHLTGDAARVLAGLAGERFDAVLLDPPRAGAAAAIAGVAATGASRVVYVSCDPATLGRDLAALAAAGLAPRWAQPLDLMPDTAHVEVVAVAERPAAGDAPAVE